MIQVPEELSPESNTKFRERYRTDYGVELSVDEAHQEAHRLLSFLAVVMDIHNRYGKR